MPAYTIPPAVPSATIDHQFSLQNLPYGVFSTATLPPSVGVAIGDYVIHLASISDVLLAAVEGLTSTDLTSPSLNSLMSKPSKVWKSLRSTLTNLLLTPTFPTTSLIPLTTVTMHMPCQIGDYTDFYSSREHATNVGIMFRGVDNALQPNWLHLPVGYHGRASSVYLSGTDVVRPRGQLQKDKADPKQGSVYGGCKLMDFELEMAFFVGGEGSGPAEPISMEDAEDRIFGIVLMNDWSARDIQKWEYVPLGPFGAKNFATTISPWVVSLSALEPYKCQTSAGPVQSNPSPLPYLHDPNYGSYDINLAVSIKGSQMSSPHVISRSNFANLYWNVKQQLVHHSVTGCNMQPCDLLGSGTISGKDETSYGSMLELCWKGTKEVKLGDTGEVRKFLKDGDEVIMEGVCQGKEGVGKVGFGTCTGRVLEAGSKLKKGDGKGVWVQA